ncbi:LysR family transcriptional regulator [Limnobacter profundi]|uniref:LysR family transcriptional regulator n=1 Tax=Limnobacter profundi TaxID=2732163 RepID=A0ABX6N6D6_9BURK|nr:LysR family transcriptional regulator [Limnobacter sp. SAORIC-580]QJR29981.1 LysR family transcriptional regulator [Limnobacter sp. SAORIC-580]
MNELVDLRVFVEVAKRLSFTDAATNLGINKSAASKAVSRTEERLGVKLIQRSTRKLSLTEEGQKLFEKANGALSSIAEAEQEITHNQQQLKGKLRIAAPMSYGLTTLIKKIPEFMNKHPKLTVELHLEDKISEIIGEGFDIAIRIAELKDSGLVARKLGDIQHVTVAASTYLKQYGMPNHPADLSAHKCLIYTYRSTPKQWVYFDTQGEEHSVSVTGSFESNNSLAIRECLLKGSGIALIPAFIVQEDIQAGRLDVILQDYSGFTRNLYAVIPDRKHINSKARAFIDFLKEKG